MTHAADTRPAVSPGTKVRTWDNHLGQVIYVRDGWYGVRIAGERGIYEWRRDQLEVLCAHDVNEVLSVNGRNLDGAVRVCVDCGHRQQRKPLSPDGSQRSAEALEILRRAGAL